MPTPNIDAAMKAAKKAVNHRGVLFDSSHYDAAIAALRAVFPKEPPEEVIEAMMVAIMGCDAECAWDNIAIAAYKALPIYPELWGDK